MAMAIALLKALWPHVSMAIALSGAHVVICALVYVAAPEAYGENGTVASTVDSSACRSLLTSTGLRLTEDAVGARSLAVGTWHGPSYQVTVRSGRGMCASG
jgi:hypothetical protein